MRGGRGLRVPTQLMRQIPFRVDPDVNTASTRFSSDSQITVFFVASTIEISKVRRLSSSVSMSFRFDPVTYTSYTITSAVGFHPLRYVLIVEGLYYFRELVTILRILIAVIVN